MDCFIKEEEPAQSLFDPNEINALNDFYAGQEQYVQWSGLDEDLLKFKESLPENERVVSPFDASSIASTVTDQDLGEVPDWMTDYDYLILSGAVTGQDQGESETTPKPCTTNIVNNTTDTASGSEFTDESLKQLSVKELNRLVKDKGLSREQVKRIKYQRRTVKNRGYAQNCRIKRIKQKQTLEEQNTTLQLQLQEMESKLEFVTKERDEFKGKYKQIKKFVFATCASGNQGKGKEICK